MRKKKSYILFLSSFLFFSTLETKAQIGIGTTDPQASLDVYLLSLIGILGIPILNGSTNVSPTSNDGDHSHVTSSINGNVTQQSLSIQNPYLALNGFIYLGMQ